MKSRVRIAVRLASSTPTRGLVPPGPMAGVPARPPRRGGAGRRSAVGAAPAVRAAGRRRGRRRRADRHRGRRAGAGGRRGAGPRRGRGVPGPAGGARRGRARPAAAPPGRQPAPAAEGVHRDRLGPGRRRRGGPPGVHAGQLTRPEGRRRPGREVAGGPRGRARSPGSARGGRAVGLEAGGRAAPVAPAAVGAVDLRANASAALAAVLLGASVVAVRVAVREVPPLSLAVLRFGQGWLLLAVALLAFAPGRLRVARRRLPLLALLGAVFFAAFPVTFNTGLRFTEASRGALMLATMPIWSAVLGRVVGERLGRRQLAGVGLSGVGIGLAFAEPGWTGGRGAALAGDGLLLVTGLLGAVYRLLAKRALAV